MPYNQGMELVGGIAILVVLCVGACFGFWAKRNPSETPREDAALEREWSNAIK